MHSHQNTLSRLQYASGFLVVFGLFILCYPLFLAVSLYLGAFFWALPVTEIQQAIKTPMMHPNGAGIVLFVQAVSTLGGFGLSSFLFLKLRKNIASEFQMFQHRLQSKALFWILFLALGNLIWVALLGAWNKAVPLPSFPELSAWIEQTEAKAASVTLFMLQMNGYTDLLVRLLVMALFPAVLEEVFFRGILQRLFLKWSGNAMLSIGVAALLFSLLHFKYTQFFPILWAGILLGFIYHKSGNLTYSILAHFIHNASLVVLSFLTTDTPYDYVLGDDFSPPWYLVLAGVILMSTALYFFIKNITKPELSENNV
jgi:membrane protease YdiL (CAAX protease family)